MDECATGWVHLVADILHLLAAGAWVGALLGLTLLVVRPATRVDVAHLRLTHRALHGFGMVGTIVVGTIVVTGLVNGWLLVGAGNLPRLLTTLYGQLLLAKLVLFGAMLGLASLNRFRLTPVFERSVAAGDHRAALGALRRSLAIEASCAVTILALVAWLGMLEPPATAMRGAGGRSPPARQRSGGHLLACVGTTLARGDALFHAVEPPAALRASPADLSADAAYDLMLVGPAGHEVE